MKHIVFLSGGLTSFLTALRVKATFGDIQLVFADTLIEDEDLYRFLTDCLTHLIGIPKTPAIVQLLSEIPDIRETEKRKTHLLQLAWKCQQNWHNFTWLIEGRTPWQVFKDTRFLGNSRMAKCSHVLKQNECRNWLEMECEPDNSVIYLGITYLESHRYHRAAELWKPWKCESPLITEQQLSRASVSDEVERLGIEPPRLYDMGFLHNNCGGFCVRGGQESFYRLHSYIPDRFDYHRDKETEFRSFIGRDVAILHRGSADARLPLTLVELEKRWESRDRGDVGGCGCFSS